MRRRRRGPRKGGSPPRLAARLAAASAAVVALVVLVASPAGATAVLEQTTPSPGAVLTTPPSAITLRFSEPVTVTGDAVRLYTQQGHRVATTGVQHPSGDTVRVPLRSRLANGAYEVTWRVVSADTNPVQGSFTFQVGLIANATAPNVTGLAQQLAHDQRGSAAVGAVDGVVRGLLYTGVALLLGVVGFGAFLWPDARRLRRTRDLAWLGWGLAVGATVALVLVQGVYGAGLGFGSLLRSSLLGDVLGSRFGVLSVARLVLLLAAAPLLGQFLRPTEDATPGRGAQVAAVVLGAAVALTVAWSGHASTGRAPVAGVLSDTIHVLAMGAWLGGLAVMAYAVFPGRPVDELRDIVPRFLRVVALCVIVLVVTGVFQSWQLVGSIHALRTTTYGKILLVKLVGVVSLVVLTAFSRQIVSYLFPESPGTEPHPVPVVAGGADDDPAHPVDEDDDDWEFDEAYEVRRLRRSVVAEVVLGLAVVAASVLLVNATPAKVAAAQHGNGVTGVTLKSPRVWIDFYVIPGIAPSANDVHATAILPSGAPENLDGLTILLEYPSRHIAPLNVPLRHLGPGHYLAPGFTIPFPGTWRVVAHAVLTDSTRVTLTDSVTFP